MLEPEALECNVAQRLLRAVLRRLVERGPERVHFEIDLDHMLVEGRVLRPTLMSISRGTMRR